MKHPTTIAVIASLLGALGMTANAQKASGDAAVMKESSPGKATIAQAHTIVATVEAVDAAQRQVTLKGPKGKVVPLTVGPDVRNLEQVKVGDRVSVRYLEALTLTLKKDGKALPSSTKASDAARAKARRAPRRGGRRAGHGHRRRDRSGRQDGHRHAKRTETGGRSPCGRSRAIEADQGRRPDRSRVHAGTGLVRRARRRPRNSRHSCHAGLDPASILRHIPCITSGTRRSRIAEGPSRPGRHRDCLPNNARLLRCSRAAGEFTAWSSLMGTDHCLPSVACALPAGRSLVAVRLERHADQLGTGCRASLPGLRHCLVRKAVGVHGSSDAELEHSCLLFFSSYFFPGSTLFQPSGSNFVIFCAVADVSGPRSFSYTMPS